MKKIFAVILVVGILFTLCACGSNEEITNNTDSENSVELAKIREEIISKLGVSDAMLIETEALNDFYGIDVSKVKQSASFATMSGTFPHEVIIIEAVDSEGLKSIVEALENKLAVFEEQSKTYDAQNYALAQKCKVFSKDNFAVLFLSPDYEEMQSILEKYI